MPTTTTENTFVDVFREHYFFVARALRYLGVRERDLDDACQEVFLVLHRRLGDLRDGVALKTFLYGICLKTALAHRRKAWTRREEPTTELEEPITASTPASKLESARSRELLQTMLSELDDEKREVYVLFEIEGMPMNQIVEVLGVPLQTGYSRLRVAREQMTTIAKRFQAKGLTP